MSMKNPVVYIRLSVLVAFIALFSRCDYSKRLADYTNQELAAEIKKNTGITVVLQTGNDDLCVHHQLLSLAQEYMYLTAKAQREFSDTFKSKYRQVIVEPTQTAQHQTGELVWLELLQCDTPSTCAVSFSKVIKDATSLTGLDPMTSLLPDGGNGSSLHLTLEWLSDERTIRFYDTQDGILYDAVSSVDSTSFTTGISQGTIAFSREDSSARGACSEPLPLQTLVL